MTAQQIPSFIRSLLVQQSELEPQFVRNAKSAYGTTFDEQKLCSDISSLPYDKSIILFKLESRMNDSDCSFELDETHIRKYTSFQIDVYVYGDSPSDLIDKLIARFETYEVRQYMYDHDVYLESISKSDSISEYVNSKLLTRVDLSINITVYNTISKIVESDKLTSIFTDITTI